ncbi:hypothetical protein AB1Y20_005358 [Prymnesium parvum]|uniref:Protein-serine/threonine kinase n=1 Tax=Prymnesium parvum TaxID=97485 RepID=A0AB34J4E4_PRYPA
MRRVRLLLPPPRGTMAGRGRTPPRLPYSTWRSEPARSASGQLLAAASGRVGREANGAPLRQLQGARLLSSRTETLEEEMKRLASYPQTSVSLKATLDTGLGLLLPEAQGGELNRRQRMLIQIATFLRRELPVRLARRVIELQSLPEGLHSMPSVVRVREWYEQSFVEIRRSRPPVDAEGEQEFFNLLKGIYERHSPTLVTMARGVHELRMKMIREHGEGFQFGDVMQIHSFLDKFYMSRIGIRILIGQYLELHREPQLPGYVGLINLRTSPAEIFAQAVEDATYLCERTHGDAPSVVLFGRTDLAFAYIPSHLYYIMFELLKNSLRAVAEHTGVDSNMPPVKVVIADGETNEDVVIKISDEGGGIARSNLPRIWSYLFTTAPPAFESGHNEFSSTGDHGTDTPLAGLGYGLPISRGYARYFGGELNIMSMEGYGTDAFLYLPRLNNRAEPLP